MRKRLAMRASCGALLLLIVSTASAYVLLSPTRKWFDTPRTVYVDVAGLASVSTSDHGLAAAQGAINAWNGGGVTVVAAAVRQVSYTLGDGISDVIFSDPLRICAGTCLAATTIGYYDTGSTESCGGRTMARITDADVAFNTAYDYTTAGEGGCTNEIYLEAVLSHEVGHVIGLAHSSTGTALMYPSVAYCNNKAIAADDIAGRDALYACTPGPGGSCTLGKAGDVCASNADCCSDSCKGKPGRKVCR